MITISSPKDGEYQYISIIHQCRECQKEMVNELSVEICQDCFCDFHELQARLQLASELIAALTHQGQMSTNLMPPDTKKLWERWVKEEEKTE